MTNIGRMIKFIKVKLQKIRLLLGKVLIYLLKQ